MPKTGDERQESGWCAWCKINFAGLIDPALMSPRGNIAISTYIDGLGWVHRKCFHDAFKYAKARNEAMTDEHTN